MAITEGLRKLYRSLFGNPTKEIDEALKQAEGPQEEGTLLFKKSDELQETDEGQEAEQPEEPEQEEPQEKEEFEETEEVDQFTEEPLEESEQVEKTQETEQAEGEEFEEPLKAVKHFDEKLGKPVILLFKKPYEEPQETLDEVEKEFEEEAEKLESEPVDNRAGKVLWKKE